MTSTPTGARHNHDPSETTQLKVPSHRTGAFRKLKKNLPRYDYEHYSRLAGPLTQPDPTKPYTVQYRSLISQEPHRLRVALMLAAGIGTEVEIGKLDGRGHEHHQWLPVQHDLHWRLVDDAPRHRLRGGVAADLHRFVDHTGMCWTRDGLSQPDAPRRP